MTLRGFIFLLVVGVAASIASGLVVERFTAPGLERTLAFAAPVALALYLAGLWGEKRGWISGHAQLGQRRQPGAADPPPGAGPTTDASAAGAATGHAAAAGLVTEHATAPAPPAEHAAARDAPVQGTGSAPFAGTDRSAGEPK